MRNFGVQLKNRGTWCRPSPNAGDKHTSTRSRMPLVWFGGRSGGWQKTLFKTEKRLCTSIVIKSRRGFCSLIWLFMFMRGTTRPYSDRLPEALTPIFWNICRGGYRYCLRCSKSHLFSQIGYFNSHCHGQPCFPHSPNPNRRKGDRDRSNSFTSNYLSNILDSCPMAS